MRSGYRPRQDANEKDLVLDHSTEMAVCAAARRLANPKPYEGFRNSLSTTVLYGDCEHLSTGRSGCIRRAHSSITTSNTLELPLVLFHIECNSGDFAPSPIPGETLAMAIHSASLLYNFAVAHIIKACLELDEHHRQHWYSTAMRLFELSYCIMKSKGSDETFLLLEEDFLRFACFSHRIIEAILSLSLHVPLPIQPQMDYTEEALFLQNLVEELHQGIVLVAWAAGAA